MSEVIKEFIRRHPDLAEAQAFERFLKEDRIRTWVGESPERRERIRREFTRVWSEQKGNGPLVSPQVRDAQPRLFREDSAEPEQVAVKAAKPTRAPMPPKGSRRLNLMCPRCEAVDVWHMGSQIECRQCRASYDDMLSLIPVKPVGPFAYLFGEGIVGVATAAGIVLLLVLLYGVLQWV